MATWPSRRSLTSSPAATPRAELASLWSPEHKVILERQLWLAVLRGPDRTSGSTSPTARSPTTSGARPRRPRLASRERERVTRHDVKARIEEFNALAGHEQVHKGMTVPRPHRERRAAADRGSSLELVRDKAVAALARLAALAAEHAELVMAGRSHNVAAQATTLGKRFATAADELLVASTGSRTCSPATRCAASRARSAPRRTCSTCSAATPSKLAELERRVADHLGFARVLDQRRPGLSALARLRRASARSCSSRPAPSPLAKTIRLMAGPRAGDRGLPARARSARRAMPHKMNTRSCERVNGLAVILRGYASMVGELAGRPVERGRRVLLGGAPGRAAGRVLRLRRAVRDVPDGARRVRRVPGRRRTASSTATCRSSPPPRC